MRKSLALLLMLLVLLVQTFTRRCDLGSLAAAEPGSATSGQIHQHSERSDPADHESHSPETSQLCVAATACAGSAITSSGMASVVVSEKSSDPPALLASHYVSPLPPAFLPPPKRLFSI